MHSTDSHSRRQFLKLGTFGALGLSLADLLRAEAASGIGSSTRAVINIHLDGGPPQMDTIDPKPDAPTEIRGEFKPIATRLPGFQVTDLMPKIASIADKVAFIRSLIGSAGRHDAFQCQSGFSHKDLATLGGRPAVGCVLAKLKGTPKDTAPPFVDLMQGRPLVRNSARPGFLGPAYNPFRPDISDTFARELEAGMKNELAAKGENHTLKLTLSEDVPAARINDRLKLLSTLDQKARAMDASGAMDAMDRFTQQAFSLLTSGKFAEAMELEREPKSMLERYTAPKSDKGKRFYTAEDHNAARKLLLARRLVEVGVRCVSVSFSDFDTHSDNFPRMRNLMPIVDHALHALITDLDERGMLNDVSIVVWGEFGRTPKVNKKGGRDHWPSVGPAMLVGGGMKVGQVIGKTDRTAARAISRPVTYQDVFATIYHNLGIDLARTFINDPTGRPQHLISTGKVIHELV